MSANENGIELVAELEGMDLDYWVAVAEGLKIVTVVERWGHVVLKDDGSTQQYSPSTSWLQGGPIIEREGIVVLNYSYEDGAPRAFVIGTDAYIDLHGSDPASTGPSHLVAAMRAYVTLKFGESVNWNDPALP